MEVLLLLLCVLVLPLLFLHCTTRPRRPPLPPGPKGWPVLGNLLQLGRMPHRTLAALARAHGPLFRLRFGRVDVVVAADSATAALFLKTHDANFAGRPRHTGAEIVLHNYQDLVYAPYGPRWRMLRKLCNTHLFSAKALDDHQHVRSEEVSLLVQRLAEAPSAVSLGVEVSSDGTNYPSISFSSKWVAHHACRFLVYMVQVNACVTNALARTVLGTRVVGSGKEAAEFKDMVEEIMRAWGVFNLGDYIPELKWLDLQGVAVEMKRIRRRFDLFFDGLIDKETTSAPPTDAVRSSLLSVLVGLKGEDVAKGEGGGINDAMIKSLLTNLFTAGTDTTSSTVEWAVAELVRHPDVLLKLREELDGVVGRDRLVSESDLPRLPYLHAVVKENFRLHPSAPLAIPHVAVEGCEVAGYHIPKNTMVLVNVWGIGRDPKVWSDPLEFRPSRFLPGGERPDVDVRGNDFEVIPFGAGRRMCVGMSLGARMTQLLVATLAHSFEWRAEREEEEVDMEEVFGITLQKAAPLRLHPVKRLLPSAYA